MPERQFLYYGVPVTIVGLRPYRPARFWRVLNGQQKALCVVYSYRCSELVLVDLTALRISQRPTDPPPMPSWAR